MASESTAGLGRWRETSRPKAGSDRRRVSAKKWLGSTLLSALLLALAAVIVYFVIQFLWPPRTDVDFIALFVGRFTDPRVPPLPQAEADEEQIRRATRLISTPAGQSDTEQLTLKVIQTRLKRLEQKKPKDAVVVYLTTHAVADESGDVKLLTRDSQPYAAETLLPLAQVIDALKQCPSQRKLLVLDVMAEPGSPLEFGATEDAVGDLIERELARPDASGKVGGASLAVLLPCSVGEVACWSEDLRQSVFGHFFLKGLIENESDADKGGTVSLTELVNYLTPKVDAWTRKHLGMRQHPSLLGSTEPFELSSLGRVKADPPGKAAADGQEAQADEEQPKGPDEKADRAEKKEEKKSEGEGKEKKSSEAQDDKKKAADPEPAGPARPVYPTWLAEGWELRERWARGPEMALAPRLFRQLEAHLIRTEQSWRLGGDRRSLRSALEKAKGGLTGRMEKSREEKRPPERSAGQAMAFGKKAEAPLVKALVDILEQERRADAGLPPDQRKARRAPMVSDFLKGLEKKTSVDVALVLVEATRSARMDVNAVQLLDSIVEQSAPRRDLVELRLLHQLADRSGRVRPQDWDDELAMRIWETVILAEQVNNRPSSLRWVQRVLREADDLRHEAEVRLLPRAFGYSTTDRLARDWNRVAEVYARIDGCQSSIDLAQRELARARAVLPAYLPHLETGAGADRSPLWLEAAESAQELDELLRRRGADPGEGSPTLDELSELSTGLADRTRQLQGQLGVLLRPFSGESVKRLIARCKEDIPEARLGQEVEALLRTPFLGPLDRQELWKTSRDLAERLDKHEPRASSAPAVSSSAEERLSTVRELVARRWGRLVALLRMADPKADVAKLEPAGADAARRPKDGTDPGPSGEAVDRLATTWGGLATLARSVHDRIEEVRRLGERRPGEDLAAWVLPALGLEETLNPIRQDRDRDMLAAKAWLGSRYRHEVHDLRGLLDPGAELFKTFALDFGEPSDLQEPRLDLSLTQSAQGALRLSAQRPEAKVEIQLALEDSQGAAEKVAIRVLDPDDERLTDVTVEPAGLDLRPPQAVPIRLGLRWDDRKGERSAPPPSGIIVQARLTSGRAFHLLVPLEIVTLDAMPSLALRVDPAQAVGVATDPLRLRTLPDKQLFHVAVRNPSTVDRKVVVEVLSGDAVIASTVAKDKPALEVKAGTTEMASFGEPAADAKPSDPLPEAPPDLSLRLRDAAGGELFAQLPIRPVIASPREYIAITDARFVPRQPGVANRLEVALRALPEMTSPPCPVRLDIPSDPDLFPAFIEPPLGNLEGRIEPGGKLLTLNAEDIKLKPVDRQEGKFSLSVDGTPRALWFRTRFVLQGQPQKVEPDETPRIRFEARYVVQPGSRAKVNVAFKVDNAPKDARLQFRLGQVVRNGFKDEIDVWNERAQRRHVGFDHRGKGGTLAFEAKVEDWVRDFDVQGIRGPKILVAYLLDARGLSELDRHTVSLVLDDLSPEIAIVAAPPEIDANATRLPVKVRAKAAAGEIKDVSFILNPGTKGDFAKAETENKLVPGKPSPGEPNTWEATIPVPKGAGGKLVVSARATSEAGLSSIVHEEVTVREPPPEPVPDAVAKQAENLPGIIQGKVTENNVAQPGLMVYLIDPKAAEKENPVKATVTTAADGIYAFTDVKPGTYQVVSAKQATQRRDSKEVTLKSGQKLTQDLDLILP